MKLLLKCTLIFLFVAIGFTSCVVDGPQGPQGPPGKDGWSYIDVKYYTVSRWALAANGRYFFHEMANPAITNYVFDKGVVTGYLVYNFNQNNEYHVPLPFDIYYNEYQNGILTQWTETVSFDIMPGLITFYYEPSDFFTGVTPPSCTFKVVATW